MATTQSDSEGKFHTTPNPDLGLSAPFGASSQLVSYHVADSRIIF